MSLYAKTISQVRDDLMAEVGWEGTASQAKVVRLLNESLVDLSGLHDWAFLTEHSTATTTDATGVLTMPDDLDRILAIHERGTEEILTQISPLEYEQNRESDTSEVPKSYIIKGYDQDTDVEVPHMEIEIVPAPASGTVYNVWYIKLAEELVDGSTTPPFPPYIWQLIQQHALVKLMRKASVESVIYNNAQQQYELMLYRAKEREKLGSGKRHAIRNLESVDIYRATRMG
jgi:hypothetical protein